MEALFKNIPEANELLSQTYDLKLIKDNGLSCKKCPANLADACLAENHVNCGSFQHAMIGYSAGVFIEIGPKYDKEKFGEYARGAIALRSAHS